MTDIAYSAFGLRRFALRSALQLKTLAGCSVAALVGLEVWAAVTGYGLRVASDTPTFLPIVRDMAARPLRSVSPFLNDPHVATSHGSPYFQLVATVWDLVTPHRDVTGAPAADPRALYTYLSVVGIGVTLLVLHAVFVWARSQGGVRAGWLTIPVLLVLFGPAHVIWAGDLTFHSFLYGAYFPQNVALAFLLYCLAALEGKPGAARTLRATLFAAVAFTVHPFTGALLAALVAVRGAAQVVRRNPDWKAGSFAIVAGFCLGALWPPYSLNQALVDAGLRGWVFVAACAALPALVRLFEEPRRLLRAAADAALRLEKPGPHRRLFVSSLAFEGLAAVGALAVWEARLVHRGSGDPLIHANRLAVYWVEDRSRWPLMLAGGAIGLAGLVWIARRTRVVPAAWFVLCMTIGVAGAVGFALPVWWRFLLFAQVPLAFGVAVALTRIRSSPGRTAATVTLVGLLVIKLGTLFVLPTANTYWGTDLQGTYDLGKIIPAAPGLVATDPGTAYFVPGATGHRVLSVTKSHVNSPRELAASEHGYALLHQFYSGRNWWQAAQQMWRRGVRYVLVAKQTSLAPATLAAFSTGPTPLVRTKSDRAQLGTYYYRNGRVGRVIYDSDSFALFQLSRERLWPK